MNTVEKLQYLTLYPFRRKIFFDMFLEEARSRGMACDEGREFISNLYKYKYERVRFNPAELLGNFGKLKAGMIIEMATHAAQRYGIPFAEIAVRGRHEVKYLVRERFSADDPLERIRDKWGHLDVTLWNIAAGLKWNKSIFEPTNLSGACVLDYGCNVGSAAYIAAKFGCAQLTILDVKGEPLGFAHSFLDTSFPTCNTTPIEVVTDTPPELPKDRFDIVYLNDVLEHVPDPVAVVSTVAHSMRRGGMLYTNFIAEPNTQGGINLKSAQAVRNACLDFFRAHFTVKSWDDASAEFVLIRR